MIEKIDAEYIEGNTRESDFGDVNSSYTTPPNLYEKACIDKINEIVDRFNEVFPL